MSIPAAWVHLLLCRSIKTLLMPSPARRHSPSLSDFHLGSGNARKPKRLCACEVAVGEDRAPGPRPSHEERLRLQAPHHTAPKFCLHTKPTTQWWQNEDGLASKFAKFQMPLGKRRSAGCQTRLVTCPERDAAACSYLVM